MNGNGKLIYWITGAIFAPIFLAVFGNMLNTTIANSSRVTALETEFKETDHRLQRIERKLDQLLER